MQKSVSLHHEGYLYILEFLSVAVFVGDGKAVSMHWLNTSAAILSLLAISVVCDTQGQNECHLNVQNQMYHCETNTRVKKRKFMNLLRHVKKFKKRLLLRGIHHFKSD